ncbi:MAG: glutathione S-transferase C-terminal domain-containing protein, partial [Gammaproteobacteria bacterium]|nr:glutathione S-transferase C-terminal domain-containing protein [Gammaproteobacteria bacterium]
WEALADGMLEAGVLIRLEHTQRDPAQHSEAWLERQRRKVTAGLAVMARDLDDGEWCTGGRFTLADIAVGCALGWLVFRLPEMDWRVPYPNLAKHYAKLMTRRSFADSAPK